MASGLFLLSVAIVILAAVWLALILLLAAQSHPRSDRGGTSHQFSLPHTPNHATTTEIVILFLRAALKHFLSICGLAPRLQIDTSQGRGQNFKLPSITTEGVLHFNEEDERVFRDAVRDDSSDETINQFFLVSLTLPLMVHLLVHPASPILPLGTVNTRNIFKLAQPELARDIAALKKASNESRLSYKAAFGSHERPGHRVKRGMEFCIMITVLLGGTTILTQELWVLQFLPATQQPNFVPSTGQVSECVKPETHESTYSQPLSIGVKDPRKWALGSKDYNPIHVSSIGARLFGFKAPIAHGNHVVALAMEQLRRKDLDTHNTSALNARSVFWQSGRPFSLDVRFIRPLILPTEPQVSWVQAELPEHSDKLSISRKGKVHIAGKLCQDD